MATMTTAAERFLESAQTAWDSRESWERTAAEGLAEPDEDALVALCQETGDDYATAEAEVVAFARQKVAGQAAL